MKDKSKQSRKEVKKQQERTEIKKNKQLKEGSKGEIKGCYKPMFCFSFSPQTFLIK